MNGLNGFKACSCSLAPKHDYQFSLYHTDELVTCESVLCASDSTTRKVKPSDAAENTCLVIKFACIIDLKTSWFITPQGPLPCLWDDDAMHL